MFDQFWMNISKSLWIKRSKIADKEHHFAGSSLWASHFAGSSLWLYHFVALKKPFCRHNLEHTTKWTTPTPPRELQGDIWCDMSNIYLILFKFIASRQLINWPFSYHHDSSCFIKEPDLKRGRHGHGMPQRHVVAKIGSSGHWPEALASLHQALLSAPVEERDYAAAITSCTRSLQWTWALRLLAEAASTGLKLGEPTWNKIVSAAGRKKAWQTALALFEQYLENGASRFGNSTRRFSFWMMTNMTAWRRRWWWEAGD